MKRIIIVFLILIMLGASLVFASPTHDDPKFKGHNVNGIIEYLQKEINLTADQVYAFHALKNEYSQKFMEIRSNSSLNEAARKQQFVDFRNSIHADVKEILNDEQEKQLIAMFSQHMASKSKKDQGK
jgi:hypothetical protein